jgi:hypothetical protein
LETHALIDVGIILKRIFNIYNVNMWVVPKLQDRSQYKVLVTTVIFVQSLLQAVNLLISWEIMGWSRRALFHGYFLRFVSRTALNSSPVGLQIMT